MACFEDDFEACIAHLRCPSHRKAIRTTNLLERLFGEERQRTKTISHAFGERAVLKRMFAALARASQSWRRLVIGEFELKQIKELKTELRAESSNNGLPPCHPPHPVSIFPATIRLDSATDPPVRAVAAGMGVEPLE